MFLTPLSPLCTPCLSEEEEKKNNCFFFLPCFFNKFCTGTFLV